MPELPSGTVTFLFTDIEGGGGGAAARLGAGPRAFWPRSGQRRGPGPGTRLWEQYPQAMQEALARHDALLRHAIETHGGHVFKTMGDQFCAAFALAAPALLAALAAQRALLAETWKPTGPLRVRMALHTGAAQERGGDYFGPALNRVARLLAVGHGGQILLSGATEAQGCGALPEGARLRDLGSHRLKDLQQPEHLFQLLHPSLPAEFPPLRSLEAFAHNLPAQLTSFIGREKEMAKVKGLLSTTRLLTLTGSGGCGKTRLALQVAADLLEEYPDGAWLVELAPLADSALVPQTVATALGLREELARPLTATLIDYLRPKSLLLVLDNCEHLLTACAQLADTLLRACPKLQVLASSREGLGIAGEQTYRVPSLSLPPVVDGGGLLVDGPAQRASGRSLPKPSTINHQLSTLLEYEAVQLFADRARLTQASFTVTEANAPSVAQVCQRLDGIPLAIELAAARVRALSVEQIHARLDDMFRLLTGGSRTALPRQQTLRALIDWSYDLLAEAERTLLRRLSVFSGGWTLEAAEAVGAGESVEAWEVLDLLTSLVDKSLVAYDEQGGEGRYRLFETVRQYARDRLLEVGEAAAVRERHRDWFLALAEQAEPELEGAHQRERLDRLEREHDNLRAALRWSGVEGQSEAGLRLGAALVRFWDARGYWSEGREHLAGLLALPAAAARTMARAGALRGAGALAMFQGDWEAARALYEESLALFRELGNKPGINFSLHDLGHVLYEQGDYGPATGLFEEHLAMARERGGKLWIARALAGLGAVACHQGDDEAARSLCEQSLAVSRESGGKWEIAESLTALGFVAHAQGDDARARSCHEEGLALWRALEEQPCWRPRGLARCLEGLAAGAGAEGRPERAARLFGAAEALRAVMGPPLPPADRAEHDRSVAAAHTALGAEAFAAAWAEGRAMPLEDAVASALEGVING